MAGDQFYSHPTFGLSLRDTHSQMPRLLYIDFELMAEQAALEHFIFYLNNIPLFRQIIDNGPQSHLLGDGIQLFLAAKDTSHFAGVFNFMSDDILYLTFLQPQQIELRSKIPTKQIGGRILFHDPLLVSADVSADIEKDIFVYTGALQYSLSFLGKEPGRASPGKIQTITGNRKIPQQSLHHFGGAITRQLTRHSFFLKKFISLV